MTEMNLDEAINYLKQYVKESHIPGQMHIDESLVNAQDLGAFRSAFSIAQNAVMDGELSDAELRAKLGLS